MILERSGRGDEAATAYRRAATAVEQEIERSPKDFRLYGPLGLAYAGLGRREEAIAAAEHGYKIMPLTKDALNGAARLWELAAVHAKVGNAEIALDHYRTLIEFTGAYSVPFLELDLFMDPVRQNPAYQALLRSLSLSRKGDPAPPPR